MPRSISKTQGGTRGGPSVRQILARLDEEVALLETSMGGLPRAVEADSILREIWIDDVHNSTAIEGNTMTRAQVEELVERGRASASLVEALEVDGYAMAADWAYRSAADHEGVPVAVVAQAHRLAVELVWAKQPPATRDQPGAWRKSTVRVGKVVVSVPAAVPADLARWSASTRDLKGAHPDAGACRRGEARSAVDARSTRALYSGLPPPSGIPGQAQGSSTRQSLARFDEVAAGVHQHARSARACHEEALQEEAEMRLLLHGAFFGGVGDGRFGGGDGGGLGVEADAAHEGEEEGDGGEHQRQEPEVVGEGQQLRLRDGLVVE